MRSGRTRLSDGGAARDFRADRLFGSHLSVGDQARQRRFQRRGKSLPCVEQRDALFLRTLSARRHASGTRIPPFLRETILRRTAARFRRSADSVRTGPGFLGMYKKRLERHRGTPLRNASRVRKSGGVSDRSRGSRSALRRSRVPHPGGTTDARHDRYFFIY